MRALLLNDTRTEQHVGCQLVIENTLDQCRRAGITVISTVPANADSVEETSRCLPDFDLLLINGEGTMHDDRPAALNLGQAARLAHRDGKRVVLFNTVWQNNRELNGYLNSFDLVFCRESLSAEEVSRAGKVCRVVPDLVFATAISEHIARHGGAGIVALDSVRHQVTLKAAWAAVRQRYGFLPMSGSSFNRLRRRWLLRIGLRWRAAEPLQSPDSDFMDRLARYDIVLSPRFHGACLGLLLRKIVISVDSNTHKLAGLYRDIGLNSEFVFAPERLKWLSQRKTLLTIAARWPAYQSRVDDYVASAPMKIAAMFEEIAALRSRAHSSTTMSPHLAHPAAERSVTCSTRH